MPFLKPTLTVCFIPVTALTFLTDQGALAQDKTVSEIAEDFATGQADISLENLQKLIAQDDPGAMLMGGILHLTSPDGNKQDARAFFGRADQLGNLDATYFLGRMLSEGIGGPADPDLAEATLARAAAGGHPEAENALRFIAAQKLVAEHGGPSKALDWAKHLRTCQTSSRNAAGEWSCKDPEPWYSTQRKKGLELIEAAALVGHRPSMSLLAGMIYDEDPARAEALQIAIAPAAKELFEKRDQRDPEALYRLGELHALANLHVRDWDYMQTDDPMRGVLPQDSALAAEYFRLAALQGHADAKAQLAWLLYRGDELSGGRIPVDREAAMTLLASAKADGSPFADIYLGNIEYRQKKARSEQQRKEMTAAVLGSIGAFVAWSVMNNDSSQYSYTQKPVDNCAGMNGLAYFDEAMGNAAAMFGGCRKW